MKLPRTIPVFPLRGCLLLPGTQLPLHIFESRYRMMVADSIGEHGLIGMVQPRTDNDQDSHELPPLFKVGCLGRIVSHKQTSDGRYFIILEGISRFVIAEELERGQLLYRQVNVDYRPFAKDLRPLPQVALARSELLMRLEDYAERKQLLMNTEGFEELEDGELVNALAVGLPFDFEDKQALLESVDLRERFNSLLALLTMESFDRTLGSSRFH